METLFPDVGVDQDQGVVLLENMRSIVTAARVDILEGLSLEEQTIRESWWSYLKPLRRLLYCYEIIRDPRNPNGTFGVSLRHFRLLPLYRASQKSIRINETTLKFLYKIAGFFDAPRANDAGDDNRNLEARYDALDVAQKWEMGFNLRRITSRHRPPTFSLTTDGCQCNVNVFAFAPLLEVSDWGYTINREEDEGNVGDGRRYRRRQLNNPLAPAGQENHIREYVPLPVSPESRVVGLDPNRASLFGASWWDGTRNAEGMIFRYDIFVFKDY